MSQSTTEKPEKKPDQNPFSMTLAVVVGQVGCVTLVVILGAILFGIWLDGRFQTKPIFTIGLAIASIPVTLVAMIWIVRSATSRLQVKSNKNSDRSEEDKNGATNQ
jgi:F0F1-type ATP synthase assembly protein I